MAKPGIVDYEKDSFRLELVINGGVYLFCEATCHAPEYSQKTVSLLNKNGAHWRFDQCFAP